MLTYSVCSQCHSVNRVDLAKAAHAAPKCARCKGELALKGAVSELSAAGFAALIQKSPLPVVVDFWAAWCGPCMMFAPTFAKAAGELADKVVFAKVDTEAFPQPSASLGIRSIPTLVLFREGREAARQSGALPMASLKAWLGTVVG